jgi:hypothetical protein
MLDGKTYRWSVTEIGERDEIGAVGRMSFQYNKVDSINEVENGKEHALAAVGNGWRFDSFYGRLLKRATTPTR